MTKEPKRVKIEADTDMLALLEAVRADGEPRVLERDGEDLAILLSPEDYAALIGEPKSKKNRAELLALAGAWKDLDTEDLVEKIYRWRHESPPSPPIDL